MTWLAPILTLLSTDVTLSTLPSYFHTNKHTNIQTHTHTHAHRHTPSLTQIQTRAYM